MGRIASLNPPQASFALFLPFLTPTFTIVISTEAIRAFANGEWRNLLFLPRRLLGQKPIHHAFFLFFALFRPICRNHSPAALSNPPEVILCIDSNSLL
jgi:hypothetical protein